MANIFDYMQWRDLEITKQVEFNEIDNLILSRLSYFPLDGLFIDNEKIQLNQIYKKYKERGIVGHILQKEDLKLFPILASSIRFGNILLSDYINKIDSKLEKQFSAITIYLPDETMYVAFRGTDNTIIGWKEDFNMSFSDVVAAQEEAVKYLEIIAEKNPYEKIRVGGHSKGGNLAVYAAAFCNKEVQDRIVAVYNNDGPGFHDKIVNSNHYKNILDRVCTYIPQTSIIGRLLDHKEKTVILKSTQTGIMQHDLYTWQVLGKYFVRDELTNSSEFIDKTITNWLKEVDPTERKMFIDVLFEILNATQAKTLAQISDKWFISARTMVKKYQNMSPESKEIMNKALGQFLEIGKSNLRDARPRLRAKKVVN